MPVNLTLFSILAAVWTLGLAGCAAPGPGTPAGPLTSQRHEPPPDVSKRGRTLFIFLPGRGTTGQDFERQGFLDTLIRLHPNADAVTVDLSLPYYLQRTATRHLHDDIIAPARARGYRRVWLVGCSIGGFGAITYVHEHPGEISGIVALAPYLGKKDVVREIESAGGLDRWQPKQPLAADDFERQLWLAIRAERFDAPGRVPLVLGYGAGDRFAYGHHLLAAQLPPDHVFKVFGFHDWATWHRLWREILDSPVSPLTAAPAASKTR